MSTSHAGSRVMTPPTRPCPLKGGHCIASASRVPEVSKCKTVCRSQCQSMSSLPHVTQSQPSFDSRYLPHSLLAVASQPHPSISLNTTWSQSPPQPQPQPQALPIAQYSIAMKIHASKPHQSNGNSPECRTVPAHPSKRIRTFLLRFPRTSSS